MPKLKDIELFKSSLLKLGNEPKTLERWGEHIQDVPQPENGVAPDIAELLDMDESAQVPGSPDSEQPDFSSFLDEMPMDALAEPQGSASPEPDGFEAGGGFGLPAGDGDQFNTPDALLAGLEGDLTEKPEQSKEAEAPVDFDISDFDEPDFGISEPAVPSLDASAPGDEPLPSADRPGDASSIPPEGSGDQEDFSVPDFNLPDLVGPESGEGSVPADGQSGEEPPASSEEFGELGDFSLPEFDIPDLATVEPAAPSPDAQDTGKKPEPAAGQPDEEPAPVKSTASMDIDEMSLGAESLEGDSFEQFNLGGEQLPDIGDTVLPDLGAGDFAAQSDNLDGQLASLEDKVPEVDNFSLDGGWGADFSIPGFEMKTDSEKKTPKETTPSPTAETTGIEGAFGGAAPGQAEAEKAKPVSLTEQQVDALQDSILSYPLNLRLAIEDIIANGKGSNAQQAALVWMLVERAGAKDAAKAAGKILKRYIEVPAGFEKRTGAAFEAEMGTFSYAFKHSILPMLQAIVLAAATAGALFFLGYNFAYRPLRANSLYAEGYRQIDQALYKDSEEFFGRADKLWTMKGWHFRYARAYEANDQFLRAEAMYDRLLARWPKDTKAALEYARMETGRLQAYEKAESILERYILEHDYYNKDALLLSADNYLAWADFEEQRYEGPDGKLLGNLYENARRRLATIMEKHGRTDEYLERMLLYFMRVERAGASAKADEVEHLALYFTDNKKSRFSAATLAELAGYLMAHDRSDYVNPILMRAVDRDGTFPEVHAEIAKWNRRTGFPDEERKALEFAATYFAKADEAGPLSQRRIRAYLDSLIRLGEVQIAAKESVAAEEALGVAIRRYERALEERVLHRDASFGKAYSLLADIYYSSRRDFNGALNLYSRAETHGYATPASDYRRGYMYYYGSTPQPDKALSYFYRAGLDREPSPYLLWATANALLARDDYFASQGYYTMLGDRLQFDLDTITLIEPQSRPSQGEIVELLLMARNNLGVTLYRIGERMGNAERRAEAMGSFTESARLYDSLSRDQMTMIRSESQNLGFLNLDFVLHPKRGIDMAIFRQLPPDMAYPRK
ncbi:MAG: hypothetical protein E4H20_04795 [Spirochaetales bacterium]|nr:MAG: hypothetical protein E4H20_04795 [Spirochaetales bacterium]